MVNWYDTLAAPIEAVTHGVAAADDRLDIPTQYVGPRTYDRIDYPAAEVLPDELSRLDGTNWQHSVVANLYFERTRSTDYLDDVLHPVAAVLDESLTALSEVDCITNYYPESIQSFAGELDNTSFLLVTIRFRATTQLDPAEF